MKIKNKIINFKGIHFYNYDIRSILLKLKDGGYLVAPAASALVRINENKKYYKALKESNEAIFDSGFFCILLRLKYGYEIKKFSGYLFLKKLLKIKSKKKKNILLIDPSKKESNDNLDYLKSKKFLNVHSYIAPIYKKNIKDHNLIKNIKKGKFQVIIINIGGEVQEVLANYIYRKLNDKTLIICTGAAIGFLTKNQAPINDFIDKYYLGWLLRVAYNPKKFLIRVLRSFLLIKLFIQK